MNKPTSSGKKTIAVNKRARFEYHIEERLEAGIALEGWEVKALRAGRIQFADSYVLLKDNEAFLFGCLINPLPTVSTHITPDPTRTRRLLLHRREIDRLTGLVDRKGQTVVGVFPTDMFDDISGIPGQVRVRAMTPLCHTSVTKWTLAAGARADSNQKRERCAKVAGEVAFKTAVALNDYFDGKWTPPAWKPSPETRHCVMCHGPDNMQHTNTAMNQQQGHMECVMCHDDHTR